MFKGEPCPHLGRRLPHSAVIRRGLRLLARSVREEPRIFSVALAGSTLYALATVASAYVLGWVTQQVILPAFAKGHTTLGSLSAAAGLIMGVSVLKCIGIVGRKVAAGIWQYRVMGIYRRRITRQYLRLPLAWHQDWTTGTLLSNANSDVEAMWANLAPFPLALGVIVMLVATAVLLFFTDWVLALVGLRDLSAWWDCFPTCTGGPSSQRAMRVQELRGAVSSTAHDSFDGAARGQDAGPRGGRDRALPGQGARAARCRHPAGPAARAVRPGASRRCPTSACSSRCCSGSYRLEHGAINTGQLVRVAYLFTLLAMPIRAIGYVFAEMPRAVVGAEPGRPGPRRPGRDAVRRRRRCGGSDGSAVGVSLRYVDYAYGDVRAGADGVALEVPVGRTIAVVGPTGSGKSTLAGILVRLVDPVERHRCSTTTSTCARCARARSAPPRRSCRSRPSCSTTRCAATSPSAPTSPTTRSGRRCARHRPSGSYGRCRTASTPWSASAARRSPAVSGSGSRWPGPSCADPGCCCSTTPRERRPAGRAGDPGRTARTTGSAPTQTSVLVVAYRRATIALADEVVFVDEGRVVARGTHEQLLADVDGYRALVTAYEKAEAEDPSRMTSA